MQDRFRISGEARLKSSSRSVKLGVQLPEIIGSLVLIYGLLKCENDLNARINVFCVLLYQYKKSFVFFVLARRGL